MFKSKKHRKRQRTSDSASNTSGKTPTFIGPGVVIEGTLQSQAPLRIDGRVKGEIEAKEEVTIGEPGLVEGPIRAARVIIAGEVSGDVTVTDFLHVLPSGRLKGSTYSPRLVVEEGAVFKGKSEMIGPEKEARAPHAPAQAPAQSPALTPKRPQTSADA